MAAERAKDVDGGWAWIVCAATTLAFFFLGGYLKGFGIFFSSFLDEFQAPASVVSLVLGVRSIIYAITAPLANGLSDRLSERLILIIGGLLHFTSIVISSQARSIELLIFANGAIGGLALACTFGPIQIVIGKYFNKRKSLAMSLTFCGATLGQIVMAPVIVKFIDIFDFRGTLLIYAAFMLHLIVAGCVARPVKLSSLKHNGSVKEKEESKNQKKSNITEVELQVIDEPTTKLNGTQTSIEDSGAVTLNDNLLKTGDEQTKSNSHESTNETSTNCESCKRIFKYYLDFSLCKHKGFILFVISTTLTFVPYVNVMIFLFPRALEIGLSHSQSALLLTIMGACEIVGRFSMGILADIKSLGPTKVYIFLTFVTGVNSLTMGFITSFIGLAVLSGIQGLCGSSPVILSMPITVEIVGMPKIAKGLGFIAFFHGIFNTVTPPVLGLLHDVMGSYAAVFYISGGLMVTGSVVMIVNVLIKTCSKT